MTVKLYTSSEEPVLYYLSGLAWWEGKYNQGSSVRAGAHLISQTRQDSSAQHFVVRLSRPSLGSVLQQPSATSTMADTFPEIKSKHSLVAKYVTEPIWAKLSRAKTQTSGKRR